MKKSKILCFTCGSREEQTLILENEDSIAYKDLQKKKNFSSSNQNVAPIRLDKFLADLYPDFSRTFYQDCIAAGLVYVNGEKEEKPRRLLFNGDQVVVQLPEEIPEIDLSSEQIPFEVLYEDSLIFVINKPRGIVVHPAPGHHSGTVVNGLLHLFGPSLQKEFADELFRPGIVHRLDKDTSGILITAKSRKAKALYSGMFQNQTIKKTYLAICIGTPKVSSIHSFITRHPVKRQEMTSSSEKGKEALTLCKVLTSNNEFSLVELKPQTGRTHQLRVHLKSIGTPILGDPIYGNKNKNTQKKLQQQLLHAYSISFQNPLNQKFTTIQAPLPQDMETFINKEFPSFVLKTS